jgi:hypothetical protein
MERSFRQQLLPFTPNFYVHFDKRCARSAEPSRRFMATKTEVLTNSLCPTYIVDAPLKRTRAAIVARKRQQILRVKNEWLPGYKFSVAWCCAPNRYSSCYVVRVHGVTVKRAGHSGPGTQHRRPYQRLIARRGRRGQVRKQRLMASSR